MSVSPTVKRLNPPPLPGHADVYADFGRHLVELFGDGLRYREHRAGSVYFNRATESGSLLLNHRHRGRGRHCPGCPCRSQRGGFTVGTARDGKKSHCDHSQDKQP